MDRFRVDVAEYEPVRFVSEFGLMGESILDGRPVRLEVEDVVATDLRADLLALAKALEEGEQRFPERMDCPCPSCVRLRSRVLEQSRGGVG